MEGRRSKEESKRAIKALLGFPDGTHDVHYGMNSTEIFRNLAGRVGGTWEEGDEIVVSSSNHAANYDPWVEEARRRGVKVRPSEGSERSELPNVYVCDMLAPLLVASLLTLTLFAPRFAHRRLWSGT